MKFINWPSRCAEVKGHFVQTISLDLMKSSEVRKAGDQSKYRNFSREMIWRFLVRIPAEEQENRESH